jgi:hypothetical protein
MTTGLMRRFSSSARNQVPSPVARSLTTPRLLGLRQYQRTITDVRPRQASVLRSWFTSSSPCLYPELDEQERQRLAERNLKLGNSAFDPNCMVVNGLLNQLQLSESFTTAYLHSLCRPFPKTSSRRTSASTCSPRRTHTSPRFAARLHTRQPYGQHQSRGAEYPSSAM